MYKLGLSESSGYLNTLQNIEKKGRTWLHSWDPVLSPRCAFHITLASLVLTLILQATFNDAHGKNFVSKADYVDKGPRAIIEMSASLL